MPDVLGAALLAVATLASAMLGDLYQARGQHRLVRRHLLEPRVQHAPDQRRVLGDVHVGSM